MSKKFPSDMSFRGTVLDTDKILIREASGIADPQYTTPAALMAGRGGVAIGISATEAARGDQGLLAYNHSQSTHAPANAQKNSDVTKPEIEAKLIGVIASHSHAGGGGATLTSQLTNDSHFIVDSAYVHTDSNYTAAEKTAVSFIPTSFAPVDAQKNSNITKAEIEAKLIGEIASHSHAKTLEYVAVLYQTGTTDPVIQNVYMNTISVYDSIRANPTTRFITITRIAPGTYMVRVNFFNSSVSAIPMNKLSIAFNDRKCEVYEQSQGSDGTYNYIEYRFKSYTPAGVVSDGMISLTHISLKIYA